MNYLCALCRLLARWLCLGAGLGFLLNLDAADSVVFVTGNGTSSEDKLLLSDKDGGGLATLVSGANFTSVPAKAAVDRVNRRIYVADQTTAAGGVFRFDADGSNKTTIYSNTVSGSQVLGVAVDSTHGLVYFITGNASSTEDKLFRCALDGTSLTVLTSGASLTAVPASVAVDETSQQIFVADTTAGAGGVYRFDSSGNSKFTVYGNTVSGSQVLGLAVDSRNSLVYFITGNASSTEDKLFRCALDGSNLTVLASGALLTAVPGQVAVDSFQGLIYVCDQTTSGGGVFRFDTSGGSKAAVYTNSITGSQLLGVTVLPAAATAISSLNRANSSPSNASTVNWVATFASSVLGVTASNFSLSGAAAAGATVGTPTTSDGGTTWNIPITTSSTDGTLQLSVANANNLDRPISSILPFAGQSYTMDKTNPSITSTATAGATYGTGGFSYTIVASDSSAISSYGATGLPSGLSVNTGTGAITGTPTTNGSFSVTISATDAAGNTGSTTLTLTVAKKALTVSGVTASNKTYDGSTTATLNTGSAALVGVVGGDTVTLGTGSATGTFASKTVGTAKTVTVAGLTIGGASSGNYTLTQPTTTANITAKTLTISGVTANNKTYDGNTTAVLNTGSATLVGVVGGDSVTLSTGSASGAFASKTVATAKTVTTSGFAIGSTDAGNYTLTQPTTTADITAATLTISGVTANNKAYDGTTTATLNTGSAALVGVIGGDSVTLSSGSATGAFASKTVANGKTVTTSGFALGSTDAGNYTLTQPTTTANVTAKSLTISGVTANNKVYDATTAATLNTGSAALVGVVGGDAVNLDASGASGAFATKTVGTAKTVSTSGFAITGADVSNYTLTQPSTTADITAKALTITGVTANNKVYNGNTTAALNTGGATLVGVVGGDAVSLDSTSATGAFADKTVATGKTVTTASFALTGGDAGNYALTQPTTTADITAKTLTISGVTANKAYDGNTTAPLNTGSAALVGVVGGDTVTLDASGASGSFADKTVANGKTVTTSGFAITGGDSGNYALTQPTFTANITAKALTVSGITASNKVYDGATAATIDTTSAALVGVIGGETVTLDTSGAAGAFATKTVGTGKTVTISGLALGGADAGNYTLTSPTTTADITAKTLTVSGITANNKVYNGNTAASLNTGGATLVGVVGGDTVTLNTGSATGAFSSKTVGTGKTVTVSGVAISGADSGNYALTQPTTTADITAKTLTLSGIAANNKVYDGNTSAVVNLGSAALVGVVGGDSVVLDTGSATGTFASKVVGTAKTVTFAGFAINGTDAGNYTLTQPSSTTANITAKGLTISGVTASNRVYDGTTAATLNTGSAALVGVVGGDTVTLDASGASGAFATKIVGTAKTVTTSGFALGGGDAGNYALTQPATTADITAKSLTISGVTASNKVYNGNTTATLNTGSAALVGVVGGDTVSLDSTSAAGAFATKAVGTAKAVTTSGFALTGGDAGNYALTQPATTADITAKTLTISGVTANKAYDGNTTAPLNTGSAALVGVVGGDTVNLDASGASGSFADKTVANGKTVTTSGFAIAGTDAGNYTLTQPTFTANITAKALTVSGITASNKVYDGATAATLNVASAALVGVIGGETVTLDTSGAAGAFADKTVGTGKTVTVSGLALGGADAGNYSLPAPTTAADITVKTLTVSGITANNKVYNGNTAAALNTGAAALVGTVGGDTVTLNTGSATGAFSSKTIGTGKVVSISGLAISGADSGNYALTQPTTTADITAKGLTVSGVTANNKVYNGNTVATLSTGSAALVGAVGGDTVNLDASGASGAFATKTVGTAKAVTTSGFALTGADSGNYTLTQPATTADITVKALTVSGVTASNKVYNATTAATLNVGSAALVGVVGGDTVTLDTSGAAGTFATKTVGTAKTVTTSGFALTGGDAGNYALTQPTAAADITAKALTVTGVTASNKVYDGNTVAALGTGSAAFAGVIGGDTVTLDASGATGAFADKNIGTAKTVSVAGIAATGADGSNYSVTQPTTTADITAKSLTPSFTANNKVYDGNTSATIATRSVTGVVGSENATLSGGTATFADKHVGTGKLVTGVGFSLAGTDIGNYQLTSTTATTTADITKKHLSVSGIAASTRAYDGTTTATLDVSAAALVGIVAGDTVTVDTSGAAGAFADKVVATGKTVTITGVALGGTDAGDYDIAPTPTATADITAKTLTVTGVTAGNKVYDGTTAATPSTGGAALVGVVGGDTVTLNAGSAAGVFASKTVGTGKAVAISGLALSGADSGNYSLTQPATAANITAKTLTVSGVTATNRAYDGTTTATLATGSAALVGVVGGDTVTLNTGGATGAFASKTIGTAKTVTISGLLLGGADAGNYALTQPSATANITAKALTVSGTTASGRVYDGTTAATISTAGAALVGVVAGDTVTLDASGASGAFANKVVGAAKPVTISGLVLTGADAANYTVTAPTPTAAISAKNLTVTGVTAADKPFDGSTTTSVSIGGATLVGVVGGDTVTLIATSATGAFADSSPGGGKSVTISGLTLGGNDGGNYTLTQPTATASITVNAATVTLVGLTQTYDGTSRVVTATTSPAGQTVAVTYDGSPTAPTNAGSYAVVGTVTSVGYAGSASGTLVVAKATQTINFTPPTVIIGTPVALSATASSGLPVTFSVVSGSASIGEDGRLTVTAPGTIVLRATQAGNGNYLAASVDVSLGAVAKQTQTIAFAALLDKKTNDGPFTLTATATSGLPVTFTLNLGPATLAGSTVTLTGLPGLVSITASQAGNAAYEAAPSVTRTFLVLPAGPRCFFGDAVDHNNNKAGDVGAVLSALGNDGHLVILSSLFNLQFEFDFTLLSDGTFVHTFVQSLANTSAVDNAVAAATRTLTLRGALVGNVLSGRFDEIDLSFSTTVQAVGPTSGVAGYYQSGVINSADGNTYTIVGNNGEVLALAATNGTVMGGRTTLGANDTFNLSSGAMTLHASVDVATTTVSGTISQPGRPDTTFAGLASEAVRTDRMINLSSRARVGPSGERALITGFVVGGTQPKRVLLRAIGPALTAYGVTGVLSNPRLQVYDSRGHLLFENDDWSGSDTAQAIAQTGAFTLSAGSHDAAMVVTLAPGAYTMHVIDGGETGIALAEIYDASTDGSGYQRLINVSSRGTVDSGDGVLVGGFVVTGNSPKRVLIRGAGPSLARYGVTGALADPKLTVFSGQTVVARNDDWGTPQPIDNVQVAASATEVAAAATTSGAFAFDAGSKDAALVITLAPGAYTAQVASVTGASGVALIEVYELP